MSKFSGIKAENKLGVLKKVFSFMCLTAHADEVTGDNGSNSVLTPTPTPAPQVNFEQLISQARKEEKEKLYPRIKKLEEENAKHVEAINGYLIKIGDLTQAVAALKAENESLKGGNGEETQEVKDLKAQIATLTADNEKLKKDSPNEEELRKQIEAEYEVKLYLNEQTAAHKDEILSSFISDVQGTTKEEIDESITKAIEKSLNIKKELGLVDDEGNPVKQSKKTVKKDKNSESSEKPVKPKAVNPTENSGSSESTFDLDYIRGLDPRSEEYKEFRKSLGLH